MFWHIFWALHFISLFLLYKYLWRHFMKQLASDLRENEIYGESDNVYPGGNPTRRPQTPEEAISLIVMRSHQRHNEAVNDKYLGRIREWLTESEARDIETSVGNQVPYQDRPNEKISISNIVVLHGENGWWRKLYV